jgi:Domain of unknown function (DUF4219)
MSCVIIIFVHLYSKIKAYSFIPSSTSVVLHTQRHVSYVEFLVRTRYVVYIFCWCRISCRCVRMSNLSDMSGLIEKLNNYNYRDWCSYIKSYLQGQDLWDLVGDDEEPPSNLDEDKC